MQWEEFRFNVRHLSDADQLVVQKAFELGQRAHEGQKRQSGEPYFSHPIAVAHILADLGADRDTVVAGLLHDTVEDTSVTLDDIEREFGPNVAMLIDGVTKLEHVDVADKPRLDEQVETLRKMFTLMQEDIRIMVIKLADRLHNMQTIGYRESEKQLKVARETMDVYVKIADRLCMRDLQNTLEGLCLTVLEPELHESLLHLRTEKEALGEKLIDTMRPILTKGHADILSNVLMVPEQKAWVRLREQLKANGSQGAGVSAVSLAFVCRDIDHCYRVLGTLHQEWQREILSFQDFINSPMINGYRALHTTIILHDGTRVRCKIRTNDMQEYAHRGVTVFCFDSQAKGVMDYLPWTERIKAISSDTHDRSAEFWDGLQSDILGSTIVVHGPDDRTVMLPRDATALDGAFYLFGSMALRTMQLYVNGQPVGFDEPLPNATTVTGTFSTVPVADLRWLHATRTGVSSAIIRTHLAAAPRDQKIAVGRELLDIALQRTVQLRLAEIDPSLFRARLQRISLKTMDELFEDLAEGTVDPTEAASHLFADVFRRGRARRASASSWLLRANIPVEQEERLMRTARTYTVARVSTEHDVDQTSVAIRFSLTPQQVSSLEISLLSFLDPATWTLRRATPVQTLILSVGVLLMLWGLDPIMARMLLTDGVSAYDLTFIRATTFFVASSVLFAGQRMIYGRRLKALSLRNPLLIFSGAALFVTALLSYLALSGIAATTYILTIIAGLLCTMLFRALHEHTHWFSTGVSLLILAGGIVAGTLTLGYTQFSVLAVIGAALGFSLYSELSRRYQEESEAIRARYPALLFWMSCVGFALAWTLLPFTTLTAMPNRHIALSIVFVLIFSVIPYSLYFEIMRRMESSLVDKSLPLVAAITVIAELLLTNSVAPLIVLPVILLFLTQFYGMYRRDALASPAQPAHSN